MMKTLKKIIFFLMNFGTAEAQAQLAAAVEKERFASEKLMESNVRLSGLESQISYLRQERSRLVAELEVAKAKVEVAEEAKLKYVSIHTVVISCFVRPCHTISC